MPQPMTVAGLVIALRGTGTGETKLKAIEQTLKGTTPKHLRELIGVVPDQTIVKACGILEIPPMAVEQAQQEWLRQPKAAPDKFALTGGRKEEAPPADPEKIKVPEDETPVG